MKKLTLLLLLFFCTLEISAQVIVNGVNINEQDDVYYCTIITEAKMFVRGFMAIVDYGQEGYSYANPKKCGIQEDGKPKLFSSGMAVLNFMEKKGWECIGFDVEESQYLMKRKE